jgi:hypothetical protein
MAATGLLEAVVALGLHALMLASMLAGTTTCTLLARESWRVQAELFRERQLEHLLDVAATAAGSGPGRPAAVASADALSVVLAGDTDGDGATEATSAERTELELRASTAQPGTLRLLHHVGRQAMTVDDGIASGAQLGVIGAEGNPSAAAAATAVIVPLGTATRLVLLPATLP